MKHRRMDRYDTIAPVGITARSLTSTTSVIFFGASIAPRSHAIRPNSRSECARIGAARHTVNSSERHSTVPQLVAALWSHRQLVNIPNIC
jgi:hypothetical protein